MFRDSQGREYEGVIVLPTVARLAKIGVDINGDFPKLMETLFEDAEKLGNALYVVHEKSCKHHGVSDLEFGEMLDGDVLPVAVESLQNAIVNFTRPAIREPLRNLLTKTQEMQAIVDQQVAKEMMSVTTEMILSTSSSIAGDLPGSSESTFEKTENTGTSPIENSTLPHEQSDATSGTVLVS